MAATRSNSTKTTLVLEPVGKRRTFEVDVPGIIANIEAVLRDAQDWDYEFNIDDVEFVFVAW